MRVKARVTATVEVYVEKDYPETVSIGHVLGDAGNDAIRQIEREFTIVGKPTVEAVVAAEK